jgi:dihydrodipicolinate synthase/N-acetylneuraminate lyase
MITPFDQDGNINEKALRTVVDFLTEHVHGLFICGTYGGGPLMSVAEKKQVIDIVTSQANGKVEIVVHVGSTNSGDAVELARHGEKAGVNRIASVPPFYYAHPFDNVLRYYGALIDAVDLPVYAYTNPKAVGYELSVDQVKELAKIGLFGVKDSTFDLMWYDLLRRSMPPEFDAVMGTEGLFLPASVIGCQAFIPGLGNAYPDLVRKLFDQAMDKDLDAAYETHKLVLKLRSLMKLCGATLVGLTEMAWLRGIDAG